jgi:hypothetical protein
MRTQCDSWRRAGSVSLVEPLETRTVQARITPMLRGVEAAPGIRIHFSGRTKDSLGVPRRDSALVDERGSLPFGIGRIMYPRVRDKIATRRGGSHCRGIARNTSAGDDVALCSRRRGKRFEE